MNKLNIYGTFKVNGDVHTIVDSNEYNGDLTTIGNQIDSAYHNGSLAHIRIGNSSWFFDPHQYSTIRVIVKEFKPL